MSDPSVSIHIVVWNSMEFLPDLLKSIMGQTFRDFNVLVIDNASSDGVGVFLRDEYPEVMVIRNPRNLGFSVAHNQGIRYALDHASPDQEKFILVTNPDIIFSDDYLERLMAVPRDYPEVGSFGGKLLRAFGENLADEVMRETIRSDRFDSVGLNPHKNRTVTDRGAGEMDRGQFDEMELVFGISGALCLYRGSALEDTRYGDEFFDQDFFAYKEDVDMAWRLQQAGWGSLYIPGAVAYHYRGMYGPEKMGLWQRITNRRAKSSLRNYYSTRNHWLMLVKNLRISSMLLALPWIFTYELSRLVYVILFEKGIRAMFDAMKFLPSMWAKRRAVLNGSRVRAREIRKWFV
ncbi:MAG: glycosyltransferase family 2 protein [Parcubacteria group bacterium]|nr:glycosyltransferase family 2 protein [Parcubacteria group bacterium]